MHWDSTEPLSVCFLHVTLLAGWVVQKRQTLSSCGFPSRGFPFIWHDNLQNRNEWLFFSCFFSTCMETTHGRLAEIRNTVIIFYRLRKWEDYQYPITKWLPEVWNKRKIEGFETFLRNCTLKIHLNIYLIFYYIDSRLKHY